MSRANIFDYPLHFEERVSVIRDLCNHAVEPLSREEHVEFMRLIMSICDGDRRALPKAQKDLVRIPYKFAWGKP